MKKKGDNEVWKIGDREVLKIQKWQKPVDKVRKPTNVGGWTEGNVATAGGSTEERRKDENGCTEVRNREDVQGFI